MDPRPTGSIAGRVVDRDGRPIATARLWTFVPFDDAPTRCARTDLDGRFRIDGVFARLDTLLTVDAHRFARTRLEVEVLEDTVRELGDIELRRDENRPLDPAGVTVRGIVVDERGAPLEGVDVQCGQLEPRLARTGRDGRFRFAGVMEDDRGVRVRMDGRQTDLAGLWPEFGEEAVHVIELPPQRWLFVRVIDAATRAALPGAWLEGREQGNGRVTVISMAEFGEPAGDGLLRVEYFGPDTHEFEVGCEGWAPRTVRVEIGEGEDPSPFVEVALERGP